MTIRLTFDRYVVVAAGKSWALLWPRRAWVAMPHEERLALILDQHLLFDVYKPAASITGQLAEREAQPQLLPDDD